MDRSSARKKQDRRGFTLAEVLAVVALAAILLSLAAPGLARSWRDLQLYELDGTAREIFLTAQNELTGKKASGGMAPLLADGSVRTEETAAGDATETLYYMTSDSASVAMGRLTALRSTLPGRFVLYLNPRTGDVTDVYYSKSYPADDGLHTAVADLRAALDGKDDRELRADRKIGYYGGAASASVAPSGETGTHEAETLELVNGEDLYLKLVYPGLSGAFQKRDLVRAEIVLRDEHGNSCTLTADGDSAADPGTPEACIYADVDTDDDYTLYVLMDSMTENCSFGQLFPRLTAGDDITVAASLSCDGVSLYQNAPVGTVNSLFAAKYPSDSTVAGISHRKGVEISHARHLSNLRRFSPAEGSAVQTADIDFSPEAREKTMLPVQAHLEGTPEFFPPVELNSAGLTVDGQDAAGEQHTLCNFKIEGENAALIESATGPVTLQNLRLVDFNVSGRASAGALAANLTSAGGAVAVKNCGAYLSKAGAGSVSGGNGGSGGADTPTGGLIGSVEAKNGNPVTVTGSFAALSTANSGSRTGGLIGSVAGGTSGGPVSIRDCYASGAVASESGQASGGLVGGIFGATEIENCFSSSSVSSGGSGGGLVGEDLGSLTVTDSYACGTVTAAGGAKTYGPLMAGSGSAAFTGCRYLLQSGDAAAADAYAGEPPSGVTACEYDALTKDSGGHAVENDAAKCHPYADALKGSAYPFVMVTAEYYGDWPLPIQPETGYPYSLCYYERYQDSTWGFYGYDESGKFVDTLDYRNGKTIAGAGYGVLVPSGTENVQPPGIVNNIGGTSPWKTATLGGKISIPSIGKDLYPLEDAPEKLMTSPNQRQTIIYDAQGGRWLYANPLFAAALSDEALKADGSEPMQIRTEEQLRNRGKISDGWYFKQTHDIAVEQTGTEPATGNFDNNTKNSVYDGGGNTISGLRLPLFETNNGDIRDVNLQDVFIVSQSENTAALVGGENTGSVSNCRVLSGSISNSGGGAAGLVWDLNTGSISDSAVGAAGSQNGVTISGNGSYAAGLVGKANTGLPISGCAVRHAEISDPAGNAAGFAGTSAAAISSCAVGPDVTVSGGSAAGFAGVNNWGGSLTGSSAACAVTAQRSDGTAAGLIVWNNGGSVSLSYSAGAVTAQNGGNAAGMIDSMQGGSVGYSYHSGAVSASGGGDAAGFVRQLSQGTFSDCFAVGSAAAEDGTASGFTVTADPWNGHVNRCYAAVDVTAGPGGAVFGFTADDVDVSTDKANPTWYTYCYWVSQSGFNEAVPPGDIPDKLTPVSFDQLKALENIATGWKWDSGAESWTLATSPEQTHPDSAGLMGKAYPYPRISGLEYYGDWPTGESGGPDGPEGG